MKLREIFRNAQYRSLMLAFLYLLVVFTVNALCQEKVRYFYAVCLSLAFMLPVFVFPKQIKLYFMLLLVFVYVPVWANACHMLLYKTGFTSASFRAIFMTNPGELVEFCNTFADYRLWLFTFALFGFAVFAIRKVRPVNKLPPVFVKNMQRVCLLFLVFTILKGFYTFHDYKNQLVSLKVRDELDLFQDEVENARRLRLLIGAYDFANIRSIFPADREQTYVVVIGESASREHMQIYGYGRPTSPLLSREKDLLLFDNVVSPHANTTESLRKALSFAHFGNDELAAAKGSVVDYFNAAGFKTFWISNQNEAGPWDDLVAVWAKAAAYNKFINRTHWRNLDAPFDEKLVPHIAQALQDKAKRKIIFVHLMGAHANYAKRFPKEFAKFSGQGERQESLAAYDNAMLYNDYVISQILALLKQEKKISYLLYFSDHAEDVRDADDSCHCHSEPIATPQMFRVPFVLWLSPEYKAAREAYAAALKARTGRYYNTEHLIHSLADLSGLLNFDIEYQNSIFSDKYKQPVIRQQ